jgi:hypothetical protein
MQNGTRIITKGMVNHSAMYSYLQNKLHYLTFSPNSEKPNNMSMVAVFLDIEKAFDTTWHLGLPYKLSKLKFSISLIMLIGTIFFSQRKFGDIQAGVPQGSACLPNCTVLI